jgi:hypothetical protein
MDRLVHETFMEESEIVINFLLIVLHNSLAIREKYQKEYLSLIDTMKKVLNSVDICLFVPKGGSLENKVEAINE